MKVADNHPVINMAKHFSPGPVFLITFLVACSLLASARDIPPRDISLVREPDENYYIVKKSPVVIVCQAKNAAEIIFSCKGTQIPPTSVEVKDVSDIDPDLIQAEIEVNRADLQNNEGSIWCECSAVDIDDHIAVTSRKATISIAHLKNKFTTQPKSTTSTVGDVVEFECGAPEGEPKAEIMWRKGKKRLEIENNPRFVVTEKGSLLIQFVLPEDKGHYQCVARNIAGRRESEEALLSVTAFAESAEPDLEIFGGFDAERKPAGGAKLRATRQSNKTYFSVEPKDNYFVSQEKPVSIDCGVVGADILTFRCNGKRMERDRLTMKQGLDSTGKRVIQSQLSVTYSEVQTFMATHGDRRTFQCICDAWYQDSGALNNGWGNFTSSDTHGFVYLSYIDEVFQAEPSDTTIGLNTDATLPCEPPRGQPSPWVLWYKDNARLDPRSSQKYSVNEKGHLTIHNVEYEDAGAYNCLAENTVNSVKSRTGIITVTAEVATTTTTATTTSPPEDDFPAFPDVIPTSPVFLRDLEADNVLGPDGTKTLVCVVISADQLTINCGGRRLPAGEYVVKQNIHRESGKRLIHGKTVITEEKLSSFSGDFTCNCVAWVRNENNAWDNIAGAEGYIRPAPETAEASFIEDEFKTPPRDTDAYIGSQAELFCEPPEGDPTPQVYWLKDGAVIYKETDENVVPSDGILMIKHVREENEGQYTCVAENEAGTRDSKPIRFTVLGKPSPPAEITPAEDVDTETDLETTTFSEEDLSESEQEQRIFHQQLHHEYYIVGNGAVILHCAVLNIKTLMFVCNDVPLKETLTTGDTLTHPLTLEMIRSNHLTITKEMLDEYNGTKPYTCFCRTITSENGVAVVVNSSPATIHVAYMEDEFPVRPLDTQVISMGRLELQCQAPEAVPKAEISWLKDGQQVIQDTRINIEDSGTLVIEHFSEDDEGTYICVANNSFDARTSPEAFVSFSVTGGPDEQVTQFYTRPETDEPEPEPTRSESGKQSYERQYISKDLEYAYYLVKNKPLILTCEIHNVDSITFICGNKTVENVQTQRRDEITSVALEASITVPRDEVDRLTANSTYFCQCFGHYYVPGIVEEQKLASQPGSVQSAYLEKIFQQQPENRTVSEGDSLTIRCVPPMGNPEPKLSLTKDGENVLAASIERYVYVFPAVQLEDAGEYICIAKNHAGKRMSLPAYVDVQEREDMPRLKGEREDMPRLKGEREDMPRLKGEREDMPRLKGGIEGNECIQMLSSCSNLLPRTENLVEKCEALPAYSACVDKYFQKCTGVINEYSMNAVRMAKMDILETCTLKSECHKLEECRPISINSPDISMENTGRYIQNLCREVNTFLQCVDQNLAECNVTMPPPEEGLRGSLDNVVDWFTQFCLTVKSNDLQSCESVDVCELHIDQVAGDNSTYWCNLIDSLLECTGKVAMSCDLDEFKGSLIELRTSADKQYCSESKVTSSTTDESVSSEANPEPAATEESTDGANVDQGNNENMKGGAAEASKEDPGNGSPVLRTSMFLATLLQLLVSASLSWR